MSAKSYEGRCHCGAVGWRYEAEPERATVCSCTVCRKTGTMWIYGTKDETVFVDGPTQSYTRADSGDLEFHFCPTCGNLQSWQPTEKPAETGYRLAVNLRLAEPQLVAHIPIHRFDGLETWKSVDSQNRTVADYWF
ncbi:MAG: GFA family protein [Pseudomonadota bacterium]